MADIKKIQVNGTDYAIDADKVDGLSLNDQAMAYVNELTVDIGVGVATLAGEMTEAELFAYKPTSSIYGKCYHTTDTNKYYRRKSTNTNAGAAEWRNDTTAWLAASQLPNQLQDEPYIYLKIDTKQRYYNKLPKFFVAASYDNINCSTTITGYCRKANKFYINSCDYNGNNILGIYQRGADTDIYYLKLKRYASAYGAAADYSIRPSVMINFQGTNPTLTFIGKDSSEYATVSAYSFIPVPTNGIYTNNFVNINGTAVPDSPKFTDQNVKHQALSANADYPILLGITTNPANVTGTVNFDSDLSFKFNPSSNNLTVSKINGATVGTAPKFTDTTYDLTLTEDQSKAKINLVAGGSGSGTDSVTIAAGSNVTVTGVAADKTITIAATDTTYESKAAAPGGTDVSLVTTGEKYTWNNKGTYSKPSGGIPKTDLASAVQTSLGLADTALQAVPSTYRTAVDQDTIDSGKVDKSNLTYRLYGTDGNGQDRMYNIANVPAVSAIAQFDSNKNIRTSTPVGQTDCANKQYVDDNLPKIIYI